MSYDYRDQRSQLFTEEGQVMFLKIRDNVHQLTKLAGVVRMQEAISGCGASSDWTAMAGVDRLVELGEIREIPQENIAGQHRVFWLARC